MFIVRFDKKKWLRKNTWPLKIPGSVFFSSLLSLSSAPFAYHENGKGVLSAC
jgi:hypothetical protein